MSYLSVCKQIGTKMEPSNFPWDRLPDLCIEVIAKSLSNKELAACCAVSREMRRAFDIEAVWAPRYDKKLAEYLLDTPCKVDPIFESPEIPNSGLGSISKYRLAFMAENHLSNNFRTGNFKREQLCELLDVDGERFYRYYFLANDLVILMTCSKIHFINLTPNVPYIKPMYIEHLKHYIMFTSRGYVIYEDSAIVKVFSFAYGRFIFKHSFKFGDSKMLSGESIMQHDSSDNCCTDFDDICCVKFDDNKIPISQHRCCLVIDNFFVGVKNNDSIIHIWNFESNIKVTEMRCPVENATVNKMIVSNSKDIILAIRCKDESVVLLAYSLTKHEFLQFKEKIGTNIAYDYLHINMFGDYVAVWNNKELVVYDYQNCQIKLRGHGEPKAFRNSIIFLDINFKMQFFNLSNSTVENLTFDDDHTFCDYYVLSDRFLLVSYRMKEMTRESYNPWQVLEVGKSFNVLEAKPCYKVFSKNFQFGDSIFLCNKAKTRFFLDGEIVHFW